MGDQQNFAFLASMCDGSKRWRVVTNSNLTAFQKELGARTGVHLDSKLLFSDIQRPFETWEQHSVLQSGKVIVYEGVLKPGETLYIPSGAPHAAETLGSSLMVASNDGS